MKKVDMDSALRGLVAMVIIIAVGLGFTFVVNNAKRQEKEAGQ